MKLAHALRVSRTAHFDYLEERSRTGVSEKKFLKL